MATYPVATGDKDGTAGDAANTDGVGLVAMYVHSLGDPAPNSGGYAYIDTSAIGSDVISAATLYWYHQSYTKTKSLAYSRTIYVGASLVLNSSATPSAGWNSEALSGAELAEINTSGETLVQFGVADPGTGDRVWTVRAWDYDGSGTYACYLEVTHAPATGGPTRFSILG